MLCSVALATRQNGRVIASYTVAREQSVNQFGIGQLEAIVRHPLIRRPTFWRNDGSPVIVPAALVVGRSWTESESASTACALLFAKHPQAAAEGGQCDPLWAPL
jgi:hypothetical protein